ncbi:MAG TPA: SCO family protein [Thermoanaerobaculia bacterium]|jgi:protein SCO1/2|nr:SCO family protein [Thermoanaerobaculia bacterium]
MQTSRPRLGGALAATMSMAWVVLPALLLAASCGPSEHFNGQVVEPVKEAPHLAGVNWNGKRFDLKDLRGKVAVVFFGYTFCPDVCPFTLAKMKQVYADLGEEAKGLEVVFVSVDPQRDSVEKLAAYVPSFDRRFYGLRLEPNEVNQAARAFGLTVQYGTPKEGIETDTNYFVDHTGTFFVIDRAGDLRLKFPPNVALDVIEPDLKKLLAAPAPASPAATAGGKVAAARLEIRDARVQLFPSNGTVYFDVVNPGASPDRLLRVETSVAGAAETHETIDDGGVMRMKARPEGFEVPAGGTLSLSPGGKHLMLVDPKPPAAGTKEIPLTLHFEHAGAIEVTARLESPGAGGAS